MKLTSVVGYPRKAWPEYWEHLVRLRHAPWWALRAKRRERAWIRANMGEAAERLQAWLAK
jgi:hypothetical protein